MLVVDSPLASRPLQNLLKEGREKRGLYVSDFFIKTEISWAQVSSSFLNTATQHSASSQKKGLWCDKTHSQTTILQGCQLAIIADSLTHTHTYTHTVYTYTHTNTHKLCVYVKSSEFAHVSRSNYSTLTPYYTANVFGISILWPVIYLNVICKELLQQQPCPLVLSILGRESEEQL